MKSEPNLPPPSEPSESEGYSETTVRHAFRWSAIAVGVVVLIGALAVGLLRRRPAPPPPRVTQLAAPQAAQQPPAEIPAARFTDITAAAGIRFVHASGAYGDKLLPETMGGGVAFLDFDNDSAVDLLFVNSADWPWQPAPGGRPKTPVLYRNDGTGRFSDVTAGSGLDVPVYGMGVAVGDYDNDGRVDIFLTAVGGNRLFHNLGRGRFADVTAATGVGGDPAGWTTACAWFDYDNDGQLDLFVGSYVRWSRAIDFEVGYKLVGIGRAYGQPMNFEGAFPQLYHNNGQGRFTDISARSGLQVKNAATGVPAAKTLGVAPVDVDNDGWMDLVLANDTVQNFVFRNRCDGTFEEIGALAGVAFDSYGNTRGAMGIDVARFRNDDSLGILIGNFANEMTALYVSQGATPTFTDEAITEGIGPAGRLLLKFGVFFFDYDLDGRLDVLTANGHLEDEIHKIQASQQYAQPAQLFWNAGPRAQGCFVSVSADKAGPDLFKPIVGRGSAFADIDGDGDLDVVLTQVNGPPLLLRNDQELGHHWLRFRLVGRKANRDAIGAWVMVYRGNEVLARQVMPTRSYLAQSELPITIGLGQSDRFDRVEVVWPGGARQAVSQPKLDGLTGVEEGGPTRPEAGPGAGSRGEPGRNPGQMRTESAPIMAEK